MSVLLSLSTIVMVDLSGLVFTRGVDESSSSLNISSASTISSSIGLTGKQSLVIEGDSV